MRGTRDPATSSHHPTHAAAATPAGDTALRRRILIAEDNDVTRRQMQELLQDDVGLQIDVTNNGREALQRLVEQNYSILLTDLKMPQLAGMQLLEEVQKNNLPVTIIVMTDFGSIDRAVQAMRLGACDFLTKPIDPEHLRLVIHRALRERSLQDEVASLREQLRSRFDFQGIISKSPKMHGVFELISNLVHTTTTVLIEGETGTGKEQVARAIHQASSKVRRGPMVAVNCAALPENLLESELFGHEKGAFTSAIGTRQGRFELADGGTIFLDEVGDVPASMQAKLLRVLQERKFERVGGTQAIEVDVRVIAATNRSLVKKVKNGTFREDLFYRLNVVKIDLPPLRDRPEDIPLLATHFAAKFARPGTPPKQIDPAAMEQLMNHRWPGNVRELENVIERACVTSRADVIRREDLPAELGVSGPQKNPFAVDLDRPLPDLLQEMTVALEKQYIRKALKKSRGNISRCAHICGLSRRSITAKIAEYKIDKTPFKE
jgi:DNA-binding NtrC family response regulator